ncbi:ATP-binding protein [Trichloromonas sp.]|uniref:ATP-binding protein n=1 Tax=Trichloromonas sp. TaxID=3069249 RepID=UPI003D817FB7
MLNAPIPDYEEARLAELRGLAILDTPPEERFDRITRVASRLFGVPVALVSLVDANRQWFKSCVGLTVSETPRDISFCGHAILHDEPLIIPDAEQDPRFFDNPLVTGPPHVRFYAGQPLHGPRGQRVGTLCLIDHHPRQLSSDDRRALGDLAAWAETELNAARLATMMRSLADGMVVFDGAGIIESLNPVAERLFAGAAATLVGRTIEELIPGSEAVARAVTLGDAGEQKGEMLGTLEGVRLDGSRFPVNLSVGEMPWGGKTRFVGLVHDLSIRRGIEQQLRDTVARLEELYRETDLARSEVRAILDATSEAMLLVSPAGELLALNRSFEQFFKVSEGDILGNTFAALLPEMERMFDDSPGYRKFRGALHGSGRGEFTDILSQHWPRRREHELFSTVVRDTEGGRLGRLFVFRDVTRERELDRMKSEFVSLVSHELRTPLTSISGYVEMLLDGDAGELQDEQADFLGIVQRNTDRLTALINDLLDVSRIEAGRIEMKPTPLDLAQIIRNAAESLRPAIEAKGQSLSLDLPANLPVVEGDPNRVVQVMVNLLSNACKYTPAGGRIGVSALREPGKLSIEVSDTGIGLSRKEQARLFTKFYRADNATTREVGGTGLGLWITRSLVELHGGTISVRSAPGAGSTFSVRLPAKEMP